MAEDLLPLLVHDQGGDDDDLNDSGVYRQLAVLYRVKRTCGSFTVSVTYDSDTSISCIWDAAYISCSQCIESQPTTCRVPGCGCGFRVNPPQYQLAPESTRTPLVNSHPNQHARLPRLVPAPGASAAGQCWCRCQIRAWLS